MITPSSNTPFIAPVVSAWKSGSWTLEIKGAYTGTQELNLVIRIDATDGNFGGGTTWQWYIDGGMTPVQSNINVVALVWQSLGNGLEIRFMPGSYDPQFVLNDYYQGIVSRPFGIDNLLDGNRETDHRTAALTSGNVLTYTVDFGAARQATGLILGDHNIPSGSTIRLQADDNPNFTGLNVNEIVPYGPGPLLYEPANPQNVRYWRVHVTLGAAVTFLRLSELLLGTALVMSKDFLIGFHIRFHEDQPADLTTLSRGTAPLGRVMRVYDIEFGHMKQPDRDKIETVIRYSLDEASGLKRPFWFIHDTTSPTIFQYMQFANDVEELHKFLDGYNIPLSLVTVTRRAA